MTKYTDEEMAGILGGSAVAMFEPNFSTDGVAITAGVEEDKPTQLARANVTSDLPIYTAEGYAAMKTKDLAAHLKDLKELKDEVKAQQAALTNEIEFLSDRILPERMEDEGIETLRIKDVGRLQSADGIRVQVLAENREALQEWLNENGFDSLVKPSVNSSTLKAFISDCIRNGDEYPTDLVRVEPYTRATVVKA